MSPKPPAAGASTDTLRSAADGVLLEAVISGQPPSFLHTRHMTDGVGMIQFARGREPDISSGYCVDDNARALLAAVLALHLKEDLQDARDVGETALRFLEDAQLADGRFHNLVDENGKFIDDVGSDDSMGRALWTSAVAARCAIFEPWRERALRLFEKSLAYAGHLHALRPRAYVVLGLAAAIDPEKATLAPPTVGSLPDHLNVRARDLLRREIQILTDEFEAHATPGWEWWEDELSWGNARLPEAMIRAALVTGDRAARTAGLKALEFLAAITHVDSVFQPIGNAGWYHKGGTRPIYDQQPIEACAMVDAWLAAEQLTGDERYHHKALDAFAWFLGLNSDGLKLADTKTGGCHDGLLPGKLNQNMGAESTLSYVCAHAAVAIAAKKHRPKV